MFRSRSFLREEAVDAVIHNHFGILQSPAGSGKTQMGIAAVAKLGKRTLWLTHTKDLLTQSKSRAELYMDSALLGTITEGKVNIGEGITFATIQTMCRLDLSQYKVNELFSGIGAFRKALIRLGIPHEIVGISEIDKYAIQSYEAIFGETRNYGDISKVSKLDYADLWTYGFPCQDISLAGNQAGIIKSKPRMMLRRRSKCSPSTASSTMTTT